MKTHLTLLSLLAPAVMAASPDSAWPEPPREAKPWTRWWWLGSGVDAKNLTRELEEFAAAGIGGVEICPIYGAKGYEDRDLEFLSPEWMDAYAHTAREGQRLGVGVDLTTGTGWPFGGPWVSEDIASRGLQRIRREVAGGTEVSLEIPGVLRHLAAWPEEGEPLELTDQVKDDRLQWTAPEGGKWRIYGVATREAIQKVKRAAPGGAGNVVDPYSPDALSAYLEPFKAAFAKSGATAPRAHFHDSFEYYNADWTPDLFDEFGKQRGYDLRDHLPAFFGEGDEEATVRIRADYRRTLDELHRRYLDRWHSWAAEMGSLTRNQAHGSPGNLLDHYAVADIPETEIFRHTEEAQIPMLRFAASAANLTGKNLVSAESFTWLDEHFRVTPQELKQAADFLWLGGVNHLFFHGIPYSPEDAGWPGWLFYASTHMGKHGGLWRDLPAFNAYIARVQSMLQSGQPDSQALLYFPALDLLHDGAEKLPLFTLHNQHQWLHGTPFHEAAMSLWKAGVPVDYASDRLLQNASVQDGSIALNGRTFKALIVPGSHYLDDATAAKLRQLAEAGGKIVELGRADRDAPGFHQLEERRARLAENLAALRAAPSYAEVADVSAALEVAGIAREPMAELGVRLVRRRMDDGYVYFIVNRGAEAIDVMTSLAVSSRSIVMMDPRREDRIGVLAMDGGKFRLILAPGESRVLRAFAGKQAEGPAWTEPKPAGDAVELAGTWNLRFTEGGPELPPSSESASLGSWTEGDEPAAKAFSGTGVYTTTFNPDDPADRYLLDLGEVAHTARVRLNGEDIGTSWSPPHTFVIEGRVGESNELEVEVTSLAANRIADLDRRGVEWKSFHEINFVNIDYRPFDASTWEPMPSGLLGPVTLTPLE